MCSHQIFRYCHTHSKEQVMSVLLTKLPKLLWFSCILVPLIKYNICNLKPIFYCLICPRHCCYCFGPCVMRNMYTYSSLLSYLFLKLVYSTSLRMLYFNLTINITFDLEDTSFFKAKSYRTQKLQSVTPNSKCLQ